MRRIGAILAVCASAAAATALAAGGGSAKADRARAKVTQLPGVLMVVPGGVGHVVIPSDQGHSCYVSSADQGCSLTPCKGFVATSPARIVMTGSADWVPITPQCRRQGSHVLAIGGMGAAPLLTRLRQSGTLVQRAPRLMLRPR